MAALPGRRPKELHLLSGHRRSRHRRRRRAARPVVRLCWPRSPSTPPAPKGCCSSRAARTAGTCCSSRTAGCITSTTSSARTQQKLSSPGAVPLGRHVFGVRYDRTGTVENSHTPLGDVTLYIDGDAVASMADVKCASGNLRSGRCRRSAVGRNSGSAVSSSIQGPVRIHRRHHRSGERRHFRRAVSGRGKRTRAGLLEGLMRSGLAARHWSCRA